MQFITTPNYLLSGHLPEITSSYTDFDLMRRQLVAFAAMETALANVPPDQLGFGSIR